MSNLFLFLVFSLSITINNFELIKIINSGNEIIRRYCDVTKIHNSIFCEVNCPGLGSCVCDSNMLWSCSCKSISGAPIGSVYGSTGNSPCS